MTAIDLDHIFFQYGNFQAIRDANARIAEGEFIGVIGPNGGGKTTLLKLIMGLLSPTSGKIHIFGKSPHASRRCIGYVPQVANFDPLFPVTTLELVLMGCTSDLNWLGTYSKQAYEKARAALNQVGLLDFASHPFGQLSGGQARRALIARAIVSAPRLLLLDEPTANIDVEAESSIAKLILELKKEMTIVMVTHELPGIISSVDRVLCVQNQVVEMSPKEVCKHHGMGVYHRPDGKEDCCKDE